jgi:phosphocarrier protein
MHARPVNLFVQLASQFESKIDVVRGDERADGKSILSILTLAAAQGTELSIEATGQDADAALDALADLVAKGFAEEEVNP